MKKILLLLVLVITAFILFSCAEHSPEDIENPDGFLKGLLHGFIILFSFIGSLFTDFKIYAFPNSGVWYDLGFLIGASAFFGGGGASARKAK